MPGSDQWKKGALEEVQSLQEKIRVCVECLLNPPDNDFGWQLRQLGREVTELRLKTEWYASPAEDGEEKIALKFGQEMWVFRQGLFVSNFRQTLYALVARALESGYFGRLKKCKYCKRFFVADDYAGREVCSDECRYVYVIKPAAKLGMQKSRARKKAEAAREAITKAKAKLKNCLELGTFRKKLAGGLKTQTDKQQWLLKQLEIAPSIDHFLAELPPDLRRIVDRELEG
jgi:hypothetical protein